MSRFARLLQARSPAATHPLARLPLGQRSVSCLFNEQKIEEQKHESILKRRRSYTCSATLLEETAKASRKRAQDYNLRRAAYKKQVSKLRKEYAAEVAAQRAADKAEKEAKRQEQTRKKLERQRLKNIRSARNAIRQREIQQERAKEFKEELRVAQENRDARKARFAKARQLVVDELEEEAHLWLTTPEEVEKAFTPEAEQLLWAHPNSVLGAPMPSDDTEFWRYESHTWHMDKTYPSQREIWLEELQEEAYSEANVDKSFWSEERLAERKELEEKAKLRAMVRDEGRRVLLRKQKELLQDNFSKQSKFDLPKKPPVPNVQVLANTEAMEKEGAEVLLNNPTKFFEFESSPKVDASGGADSENEEHTGDASTYQGPSLGASVGLKDPIRTLESQNRPYPVVIGRMPKPDLRSEKEIKREAKERAMWAATQGGSSTDKQQADIEFEAEDKFDIEDPIDYEELETTYDSDDEERKEEDVDWVIGELEQKVKNLEEQLRFELETVQHEISAKRESEKGERKMQGEDLEDYMGSDAIRSEGTDDRGQSYVQYELPGQKGKKNLGSVKDSDMNEVEELLSSLTGEQLVGLYALEDLDPHSMSPDELREALEKIPGLSESQVTRILNLEASLGESLTSDAPELGDDDDTK